MEFDFEDFKKRASDCNLSKWEKIGFPDSYRKGVEHFIFQDIIAKTDLIKAKMVLDIGCGCSELVDNIINYANENKQTLVLIDSNEMLNNIDNKYNNNNIILIPDRFPSKFIKEKLLPSSFDVIIVYSVIQYVFLDQSIYDFIHACIKLLKSGGRILIGDIPNFQARDRFLITEQGKNFLAKGTDISDNVALQHENSERIDDSVIMSILLRFRQFGCETYLMPQSEKLPFSNRREDILIIKR